MAGITAKLLVSFRKVKTICSQKREILLNFPLVCFPGCLHFNTRLHESRTIETFQHQYQHEL